MFNRRENLCYGDIIAYFKQIKPEFQDLKPLVCKIFELILVLSKLRQDLKLQNWTGIIKIMQIKSQKMPVGSENLMIDKKSF